MGEDAFGVKTGEAGDGRRLADEILPHGMARRFSGEGRRHHPESAHARVHLHVHPDALAACDGSGGVGAGGGRRVDGLPQVVVDQAAGLGRRRVAEHQDRHAEAGLPQGDRFRQAGDPQPLGAVGERRAGHLDGAVAVAVGFDDGHHLGLGVGAAAQLAHVVGDGAQVDFGPDQGIVVHRVSRVHGVYRVGRIGQIGFEEIEDQNSMR